MTGSELAQQHRQRLDDDGSGEKNSTGNDQRILFLLKLISGFIILWWLIAAAVLPPVQDEAYYSLWSRWPAWGYFDHPPLVAMLAIGYGWFSQTIPPVLLPLVSRLGTLLLGILTLWVSLRLFRLAGLKEPKARLAALLLSHGNLMGLIYGFLTTPDSALIFCWVLALHEASAALRGQERRWLTAGLATGLGLLAKYTMLLIGPVFLWALWQSRQLRRPWPYLGGCLALLVFLPNLLWNYQHDWITLRFQARHGFSLDRPAVATSNDLPQPERPQLEGPEFELAKPFLLLADVSKKTEKQPRPWDETVAAANRYVGYYASQVGFWGVFLFGVPALWRDLRHRRRSRKLQEPLPLLRQKLHIPVDLRVRPLITAALWVPLFIFGLISLFSKVEANWSAMYVFAAAIQLAPYVRNNLRFLIASLTTHILLIAIVIWHAYTGLLPTRPHRDRVLLETYGYPELATHLAKLSAPIFADTYQTTAMALFWQPQLTIRQWPGITRLSEFVTNPRWLNIDAKDLRQAGQFFLVQNGVIPPRLTGFRPVELTLLRNCLNKPLQVIDAEAVKDVERRCREPVHEWYLTRYIPQY